MVFFTLKFIMTKFRILMIFISISIIIYGIILNTHGEDYIEEYEFRGIVQKTSVAKGGFWVFVKDKEYFISGNTLFNHKMSIGDSIIKIKNSKVFWVINSKTKRKSYYE
jgi:hypothetical protein